MALPDSAHVQARQWAPHHIQAEILKRVGEILTVRVTRVFRGPMKGGEVFDLFVCIDRGQGDLPIGPVIFDLITVASAKGLEAYLHLDPPTILADQVRFLNALPDGPATAADGPGYP